MKNLLSLFVSLFLTVSLLAQGPALPEGLCQDARATWIPTLDPTATVVVDANGNITSYKTGFAVSVPVPLGRSSLGTALNLCENNDGDWVGFLGEHKYELGIGDKNGNKDTARPIGYQGISLVGLDKNTSIIRGFTLSQRIGVQKDFALLHCVVDSWSIMPVMTVDLAHPPFGNIYIEQVQFLGVSNDQPGLKTAVDPTTGEVKNYFTTRVIRGHGAARWHILHCKYKDGVVIGDGLAGASEHFFYYDAQQGDSEVIGCEVWGTQYTMIQSVTRYTDRIKLANGQWAERYAFGTLLVEDCVMRQIGSAGTWAINICGGLTDVIVKNCDYLSDVALANTTGQVIGGKWSGGGVQAWADNKVYELDPSFPPGQGPPIAKGYSLSPPGGSLPDSEGVPALGLPIDGFPSCRSLTILGGSWVIKGGAKAPMFNIRDCARVIISQGLPLQHPFKISGATGFQFAGQGVHSSNAKMGNGLTPAGSGLWQQALFLGRGAPSTWAGSVKLGKKTPTMPYTLSDAELDTWTIN